MPIFRGNPRLLRDFRDGSRDALERVYQTYVDRIAGIVRHGFRLPGQGVVVRGLGFDATECADVVQEVFAKSFSHSARRSFDGLRDYGPYLYAITRNVLADRLRRSRRELPTPWEELQRAQDSALEVGDEAAAWGDERSVAVVRAYVATLDGRLRDVHQTRYIDGLSQREAAQALGIGRQTLRTLEDRLRAGLRRELERH